MENKCKPLKNINAYFVTDCKCVPNNKTKFVF